MKSIERQLHASLAIVAILILTGLLVFANLSTRNVLLTFVTSRLDHDAVRLLDALTFKSQSVSLQPEQLDAFYNEAYSGHYFAIRVNGSNLEILYSASLQGETLALPDTQTYTTLKNVSGPQGQRLIIRVKHYEKQGHDVVVSVAEDMSVLIARHKHFRLLFISIGLVGFVALFFLQRFVIRRQFKHLDQSRAELKLIETGDRQQLSENVPVEIFPLVREINHRLSVMQQRLERSRNALGNLAHALKTPLAILMQNLGNNSALMKHAERIHHLTDRELKRARLAGLGNSSQRFNPAEELSTLIEVLQQSYPGKNLDVTLTISEPTPVFGDREDMLELLGNLLDNAYKWADARISCAITTRHHDTVEIIIEDDGKGTGPAVLEHLTQRGTRMDETVSGHGLGLAICKDIVKLYGGDIQFARSMKLGGLRVSVKLSGV